MLNDCFFALIRQGLWDEGLDESLFEGLRAEDWHRLMDMSRRQALIALTFDGVCALPPSLRPPQKIYLQWAALTLRIEAANKKLNDTISRIFPLYNQAGLHPLLLKGQGVAVNYRHPLHRQCGDVDVFLGKEGAKEATRLLLSEGAEDGSAETMKHMGLRWQGVDIEHHRVIADLKSPGARKRFCRWADDCCPSQAETVEIGLTDVPVPPLDFNVVYLFIHSFDHLLNGGIGLRQLCDWACLLRRRQAEVSSEEVCRRLESFGLLRAAKAFGYIAVHYLGLAEDVVPFDVTDSHRMGEMLLDDILRSGNFGQYDLRYGGRPSGYWAGKWYSFKRSCHRCLIFGSLAPGEACWFPLHKIQDFIYKQSRPKDVAKRL